MRKHDSIKKTLLSSVLSVVLCISMLIGTTYAWFSENISYQGTRIQTGTLDAELYVYNPDPEVNDYVPAEDMDNIFANYAGNPIEPGEIQVVYLQVKNIGKYALDYNIKVGIFEPEATDSENLGAESSDNVSENSENAGGEPAENVNPASILEYAVMNGLDAATGLNGTWGEIGTRAKETAGEKASGIVPAEEPVEIFAQNVTLPAPQGEAESVQYFALAICIPEGASMDCQGTTIENLGVQIAAEQVGITAVDIEDTVKDSTLNTD